MTSGVDLDHDRAICLDAARAAAAVLAEGHGRAQPTRLKAGPLDLVTEFDRRAEAVIVARLRAADPEALVVAEEGGRQGSHAAARVYWVDPLDGTTNFAHGLPLFSVSIGLYEDGAPRAAVVAAPALGWEFAAARGQGATCNGAPLRVSSTPTLHEALLVTGFPYDRRESADNNFRRFEAFAKLSHGVRRLGSAALDLCCVARGWFDGYWERKLKPWDLAAGMLIAAEAGARVTAFAGGPTAPERGEVVATNGLIHDAVLEVLARVP
ncbi:MAG: inositol monophosphatase [Deltaproteobacteria bacterium]|nr:inositol monophosphatase [Deltaproteobacteria bacterium]